MAESSASNTFPSDSSGDSRGKSSGQTSSVSYYSRRLFQVAVLLRFLSLAFTSVIYLAGSYPPEINQKLFIVVVLAAFALLTVKAYQLYWHNLRVVKVIVLLECFGITALMLFTGGLDGPFVWYLLNPLIIAAMYLPLPYAWYFLGLFISWGLVRDFYLQQGTSLLAVLYAHLEDVLILSLFTLIVQLFSRIYHALEEKSRLLSIQQDELTASFLTLTENHHVLQSLSEFQRTVVSFKQEADILKQLVEVSSFVFPFEEAAILYMDEPLFPETDHPFDNYRLILGHNADKSVIFNREIITEIWDRRQELFLPRALVKGAGQKWIAMPIRLEKKKVVAVFLGQLKGDKSWDKFTGNVYLFIQFTELVIQSLRSLKETEETLYQISSLYEAVETISSRESPRETMDLFGAFARKLTKSDKVIFWMDQAGDEIEGMQHGSIYSVKGKSDIFPEECWQAPLLMAWGEIREHHQPLVIKLEDERRASLGQMICVPVQSRSRCFGVLAALQAGKRYNVEENLRKLSILSGLSAVTIERNMSDLFSDKLLVLEEQKRIANEIHDNISQNLFSIVYGLQSAIKHAAGSYPELQEQLAAIQHVAANTAKDLRVLIYRLSPRHRGDDTFLAEVRTYLDGLAQINDTVIDFQVAGTEEFLNPAMRKAFYRIIKEATSNAIRHGSCRKIGVNLEMSPFVSNLTISNDGRGFEPSADKEKQEMGGLGIINMRELAHSLQGSIYIQSAPGEGTFVSCSIPTSPVSAGRAGSR